MNIDIDFNKPSKEGSGQQSPITPDTIMSVSGILHREGEKCVCVTMEDDSRFIEVRLPEGEILSRRGYTQKEAEEIISYLNDNMDDIMNAARKINPMTAFMK